MMKRKIDRGFWYVSSSLSLLYETNEAYHCVSQIWLFKPSIMMSWSTPTYRAISGEGNQLCAKVLFKILEPSVTKDTIDV